MTARGTVADLAAELRREFDEAFAHPSVDSVVLTTSFLGVRVDRAPYAIALSEIGAVQRCRAVTSLPSRVSGHDGRHPDPPGLVGVADAQASLVAVFDVGSLLRGGAPVARSWLVVARRDRQVAFTVDAIDGLLSVEDRCVLAPHPPCSSRLSRRVLDDGSGMRPILDVGATIDALREAIAGAGPVS